MHPQAALLSDAGGATFVEALVITSAVVLCGFVGWELLGAKAGNLLAEETADIAAIHEGTQNAAPMGSASFSSLVIDVAALEMALRDRSGWQASAAGGPNELSDVAILGQPRPVGEHRSSPDTPPTASKAGRGPSEHGVDDSVRFFSAASDATSHYLRTLGDFLTTHGNWPGASAAAALDLGAMAFDAIGHTADGFVTGLGWLATGEDRLGDMRRTAGSVVDGTRRLMDDPTAPISNAWDRCSSSVRGAAGCGLGMSGGVLGSLRLASLMHRTPKVKKDVGSRPDPLDTVDTNGAPRADEITGPVTTRTDGVFDASIPERALSAGAARPGYRYLGEGQGSWAFRDGDDVVVVIKPEVGDGGTEIGRMMSSETSDLWRLSANDRQAYRDIMVAAVRALRHDDVLSTAVPEARPEGRFAFRRTFVPGTNHDELSGSAAAQAKTDRKRMVRRAVAALGLRSVHNVRRIGGGWAVQVDRAPNNFRQVTEGESAWFDPILVVPPWSRHVAPDQRPLPYGH